MPSFRIISVVGPSHIWSTNSIPYEDLTWVNTPWDPLAAYGQSNLAWVLFTRELLGRAKLKGSKVSSYIVHPGNVASGFNQYQKVRLPEL